MVFPHGIATLNIQFTDELPCETYIFETIDKVSSDTEQSQKPFVLRYKQSLRGLESFSFPDSRVH
jgi:hypothetical protein